MAGSSALRNIVDLDWPGAVFFPFVLSGASLLLSLDCEYPFRVFNYHLCDQGLRNLRLAELWQECSKDVTKAVSAEIAEVLNLAHVLGKE
jgi:hypothetical protein